MIDVEQQVSRLEQIYRQIAGAEPRRSDVPIAPIPPEANAEQVVNEHQPLDAGRATGPHRQRRTVRLVVDSGSRREPRARVARGSLP
jgi:hypothetical protein